MSSLRSVPRASWKALFAGQIGWMLDAMDFMLFTFALRAIQKEFGLESYVMGLLITVALVAGAAGGIFFGRLADRIGRVRALTWSILIYAGATAGLATSSAVWQLVAWRVAVGIGMGGEWSCGSVLVAETWPAEHRAKAIGFMQSGWAIGALIAAGLSALVLEPSAGARCFCSVHSRHSPRWRSGAPSKSRRSGANSRAGDGRALRSAICSGRLW